MKLKRFLSVLLVLAMVLSLLPTVALADGGIDVNGITSGSSSYAYIRNGGKYDSYTNIGATNTMNGKLMPMDLSSTSAAGQHAQILYPNSYYHTDSSNWYLSNHNGQYITKLEFVLYGHYHTEPYGKVDGNGSTGSSHYYYNHDSELRTLMATMKSTTQQWFGTTTVKLGTTSKSTYSANNDYVPDSELTQVFHGKPYIIPYDNGDHGWTGTDDDYWDILVFELDEPFYYDNSTTSLVVDVYTDEASNLSSHTYGTVDGDHTSSTDIVLIKGSSNFGLNTSGTRMTDIPRMWIEFSTGTKNVTVTPGTTTFTADGTAKSPTVTVHDNVNNLDLTAGTHYTVSYSGTTLSGASYSSVNAPVTAGSYTMTLDFDAANNGYTGAKTVNFTVNPDFNVAAIPSQVNTGTALTPVVTVTDSVSGAALTEDTDYTVSVSGGPCISPATYTVTVTGAGAYSGITKTAPFTVTSAAGIPSVAWTQETVDASAGVYKLVGHVTSANGVMSISTALSFDNTVIQPVDKSAYTNYTVVEGTTRISSVKCVNPLLKVDGTDDYSRNIITHVSDSRSSVELTQYIDEAYTTDNPDADYMEFFFKIKDGKTMNASTFRFESLAGTDPIAIGVQNANGDQWYHYDDWALATDQSVEHLTNYSLTYDGCNAGVVDVNAPTQSNDTVLYWKYVNNDSGKDFYDASSMPLNLTSTSSAGHHAQMIYLSSFGHESVYTPTIADMNGLYITRLEFPLAGHVHTGENSSHYESYYRTASGYPELQTLAANMKANSPLGHITVKLGTTALSQESGTNYITTNLTEVFSGIPYFAPTDGGVYNSGDNDYWDMLVIELETPYIYNGNNLVVDIVMDEACDLSSLFHAGTYNGVTPDKPYFERRGAENSYYGFWVDNQMGIGGDGAGKKWLPRLRMTFADQIERITYIYDPNESLISDGSTGMRPDVTVHDNTENRDLVEGTDYRVRYTGRGSTTYDSASAPTAAGDYTMTLTFRGGYTGTWSLNYQVLQGLNVNVTVNNLTYDGSDLTPTVVVTDPAMNNAPLAEGTNYTWAVDEGTVHNAGTYHVTVTGVGDYVGTKSATFQVLPATPDVAVSINGWTYGAAANDPYNLVASFGLTPTVAYYTDSACTTPTTAANSGAASEGGRPVNAGNYWVKASVPADTSAYGNWTAGSATASFTIAPQNVVSDTFASLDQTKTVNDGTDISNFVPLNYQYMCEETNSSHVPPHGQVIFTADMLGLKAGDKINSLTFYYCGGQNNNGTFREQTVTVTAYSYQPVDVPPITVKIGPTESSVFTRTNSEYTNFFNTASLTTMTLTNGQPAYAKDYMTITFSEPYTYTGGNLLFDFTGSKVGDFNSSHSQLYFFGVNDHIYHSASNQYYSTTQWAQEFAPKATFTYDTTVPSGVTVTKADETLVAGGNVTPTLTVRDSSDNNKLLVAGTDYDVTYDNGLTSAPNTAASHTAHVNFKGNYTGTIDVAYTVNAAANFTINLSATELPYNGAQQTPSFTVTEGNTTLSSGTDYTYTVSGNHMDVGMYTITVTGVGSYAGATKTAEYNIVKVTPTVTVTAAGWTYGDTTHATPSASSNFGTPGAIEYSSDNSSWTTTVPTNAGTYTARATVAASSNWNAATGTTTFTISPKDVTNDANYTVTAITTSFTYDGSGKAPQITVKKGDTVLTSGYTKTYEGAGYANNSAQPVNAGSYRVCVTFTGNLTGTKYLNFEITKANPTANAPTGLTATYGQTLSSVSLSNPSGNTPGTWSWVDASASVGDVGTNNFMATFTPTDTANYNTVSIELSVTVSKVAASVSTSPTANNNLTYTGSAQALVTAGTANGGTMEYKLGNGDWDSAIPQATDAGSYTVYYKVDGDDNHSDSDEGNVIVSIAKANPTANAPTGLTVVYGSTLSSVTLTNPNGNTAGTWTWVSSNTSVGDVGTKTFKANFTPTDTTNYNTVSNVDVTVTVTMAGSALTKAPSAKSLTYTGSAQALVDAGAASGGTLQYKLNDGSYSETVPTAIDAGDYTVFYKVVGDNNHTGIAETSISVTIAKADPTATAPTAKTLTYTGSEQALVNAGTSAHGSWSYSTAENGAYGAEIPTGTNADSYTVWFKFTGDTNHNDIAPAPVNVTIAAKAMTVSAQGFSGQYDGSAHGITVTVTEPADAAVTYSETENGTYSQTNPTYTTPGTHTVYYKVTKANYTGVTGSATVTITGKSVNGLTITLDEDTFAYDGSNHAPQASVMDGETSVTSYTMVYSLNQDGSSPTAYGYANVGTYYVVLTFSGNYTGTRSVPFTITRGIIHPTIAMDDWHVGQGSKTPTLSGHANQPATYTYKVKGADDSTYSATAPVAVGEYTVKATFAQSGNYNAAEATTDFRIVDHRDANGDHRCDVCGAPMASYVQKDTRDLSIPDGTQASYVATFTYGANDRTTLKLGDNEIFDLNGSALKLCGNTVNGAFGAAGEYTVVVTVNPTQMMLNVEVTLPDDRVVRRGTGYTDTVISSSRSYTLTAYAYSDRDVDVEVTYPTITTETVTINGNEPSNNDIIYALTTSFTDARTDRAFAWTATTSADMKLRYRVGDSGDWTEVAANRETASKNGEYFYKVDIDHLEPIEEYQYQIWNGSTWSNTYTFTTASADLRLSQGGFTFVAVGDGQAQSWNDAKYDQATFAKAAAQNPAFVLNTGDSVEQGYEKNQWSLFFKSLGEVGKSIPLFSAIGNHDFRNQGNSEFYFDLHFNHPNNGPDLSSFTSSDPELQALARRAKETVYSYDYGDVHFIVLNSGNYNNYLNGSNGAQETDANAQITDNALLEAQRDWLVADLAANDHAKWTVVMVHEPVYHRLEGTFQREALADLLDGANVDLVISGHSHLVTRSYPIDASGSIVISDNADTVTRGSGTVYVTVGSMTSNHDTMGNPNSEKLLMIATPKAEMPTYATFNVSENALSVTVKQLDGLVLDNFTITGACSGDSHTVVIDDPVEPTCTKTGLTEGSHCSDCGDIIVAQTVIPATGHNMTGNAAVAATCEKDGNSAYWSCDLCGKYFSDANGTTEIAANSWVIPALGHSYGEASYAWADDNSSVTATRVCSRDASHVETETVNTTSEVTKEASCTEAGSTTYTSEAFENTVFAVQTKEVVTEALGHTMTEHPAVPATCGTAGNSAYWSCETCGKYFSNAEGTTEIADNGWVIPATGNHTAAEAVQENIVKASCTAAGSYDEVVYCSVCNAEMSREHKTTAALGHDYVGVETEPTCTEAGYTTYTCSRCGDEYTESGEAALGHDWGEWMETTPATEDTEGEESRTCTRCNLTETCGGADGHKYETEGIVTAPTCTKQGYTTYTCTNCGHSYVDDYVNALGHDFSLVVETIAPTCTENGYTTYECSRCDATETRDYVDALGHTSGEAVSENEKPASCTETGSHDTVVYCTVCKAELSRETVTDPALGHNMEEHPAVAKTCTKDGNSAYWSCDRCNKFFSDAEGTYVIEKGSWIIPASHNLTAHEAVPATCDEAGNTAYWSCEDCDKFFSDASAENEIEEGEWVSPASQAAHKLTHTTAVPATCTAEGNTEYWTCSVCGKYFSDENGDNEIDKDSWITDMIPHTEGEAVRENEVPATCTEGGSYDEVVYCTKCGAELSRETITTDMIDHTPGEPVHENEVAATLDHEGGYDDVVYCTVCHEELSRNHVTTDKLTDTFTVTENKKLGADDSTLVKTHSVNYKDTLTLTAGEEEGYTFIGWFEPNGVLLTASKDYSIEVRYDTVVEARYEKDKGTVYFVANGQTIVTECRSDDYTQDELDSMHPYERDGFEFVKWDKTAEEINAARSVGNVTVTAEYKAKVVTYTVRIFNGYPSSEEVIECTESQLISRNAEEVDGKVFAYWQKSDGTIFSYAKLASFRATEDITITAIYADEAVVPMGTATMKSATYNSSTKKATFVAYLTVPDYSKIVRAGLVATNDPDAGQNLTAQNALYVKTSTTVVGKCCPVNYTWSKTKVNPGDTWYLRAYLVYTYQGQEYTIYSDLMTYTAK